MVVQLTKKLELEMFTDTVLFVYFFKLIRSSFGQSSFQQMYLEEAKSEHLSRFAQSRRAEAHLEQRFKASAAASIRGHVQNVSKE